MNDIIKDIEGMTDKELLKEFAERFMKYDSLRDCELNLLDDHPNRDVWDEDLIKDYEELLLDIDNAWVRVRECLNSIKER